LLFAGQQLHLLHASLQLRNGTGLGAHGMRLTTQEFGDRNLQRRRGALNEIQRRVWRTPFVIVIICRVTLRRLASSRCDGPLLDRAFPRGQLVPISY
jgi:hypothetical protein